MILKKKNYSTLCYRSTHDDFCTVLINLQKICLSADVHSELNYRHEIHRNFLSVFLADLCSNQCNSAITINMGRRKLILSIALLATLYILCQYGGLFIMVREMDYYTEFKYPIEEDITSVTFTAGKSLLRPGPGSDF